jgi:hypothetical protein
MLPRRVALERLLMNEYKFIIEKTFIAESRENALRISEFGDADGFVTVKEAVHLIQMNLDKNAVQIVWLNTSHLPVFFRDRHLHPAIVIGMDNRFVYLNDPSVGPEYPYGIPFVVKALQWIYEVRRRRKRSQ